jgi:hypothetical protein
MTGWMKLLKDVGMLNEASPESVQLSMRMDTLEASRLLAAHHPFTESLTLQLFAWVGWWEVGGEVFFFQAVFGVESGQSMSTWTMDNGLSMQVLFGRGGEDLFSFPPMGRPKVPCFYSF